jgi:hypothetical protein
MRIQRLFAYAFAAYLVLLGTGVAIANDEHGNYNASLNGTYRIFTSLNNVGSTATLKFIGVITYDGKGRAWMADRGTIIDSTAGTASSFEETGEFTYKVKHDGSFTQEVTFTSKPVGDYVITGVNWVGQIGAQGSILILSGAIPPGPQIFTSGGASSVRYGVVTGTAVRIP